MSGWASCKHIVHHHHHAKKSRGLLDLIASGTYSAIVLFSMIATVEIEVKVYDFQLQWLSLADQVDAFSRPSAVAWASGSVAIIIARIAASAKTRSPSIYLKYSAIKEISQGSFSLPFSLFSINRLLQPSVRREDEVCASLALPFISLVDLVFFFSLFFFSPDLDLGTLLFRSNFRFKSLYSSDLFLNLKAIISRFRFASLINMFSVIQYFSTLSIYKSSTFSFNGNR